VVAQFDKLATVVGETMLTTLATNDVPKKQINQLSLESRIKLLLVLYLEITEIHYTKV